MNRDLHITYFTETNLAYEKPAYQSSTYDGASAARWGFFKC